MNFKGSLEDDGRLMSLMEGKAGLLRMKADYLILQTPDVSITDGRFSCYQSKTRKRDQILIIRE